MALKGQAKKDYQREYMRRRRGSNTGLTDRSNNAVRPNPDVRPVKIPELDADGNPIPEY